jgi:DNA repair exonuclease SbcCD ATPase subunit
MTIQELVTKYSNANEQTLEFIEKILKWKERVSEEQASEFIQKMVGILEKHGEVCSWESVREQLVNEISRLNVERSKMKKERENIEESLEKKKQWFGELEKAKNDLTALEEEKSKLHKDDLDKYQRYSETKKMVEELQQNCWLSYGIKESINNIWATLPLDELDKALTK